MYYLHLQFTIMIVICKRHYTLVSHDPFFQKIILIFYMSIPYPFALQIKCYSLSQSKWSMFNILPRQFE